MDEDIPLPVDLPAAAVRWAYCPVPWQQMAGFHMGTAGRARQKIHPTEAIPRGYREWPEMGQSCALVGGRDSYDSAPKPDLYAAAGERASFDLCR